MNIARPARKKTPPKRDRKIVDTFAMREYNNSRYEGKYHTRVVEAGAHILIPTSENQEDQG
jgi:hypothetical protein